MARWTFEPGHTAAEFCARHLRSADFLDVERHPMITFDGSSVELVGDHDYTLTGTLMIRGVSRQVRLAGTWDRGRHRGGRMAWTKDRRCAPRRSWMGPEAVVA